MTSKGWTLRAAALSAALLAGAAAAQDAPPTFTNATVLAVDPLNRTMLIRNARGAQETVQLDDNVAGFADIKAGDRAILTLRGGPGWTRVSSIYKSRSAPALPVSTASVLRPADPAVTLVPIDAFRSQVQNLSTQADPVDSMWSQFKSQCAVVDAPMREGGRPWFVLWEGPIRADMSTSVCRELFDRMIDMGEPVRTALVDAEDHARRDNLSPGEMRDIRRRYRMEWSGTTPPSPPAK